MSSAARFVLEFEATGDQEVVNKIRAVGAAGKETATELESLQGIEDPFEPIASGADAAIAPIEGVGTAAEAAVTPITDMGSATDETISVLEGAGTATSDFTANLDAVGGSADAATGGLTNANTVVGEFGTSSSTAGESVAGMAGQIGAMGGIVGSVVTSVFSLSNAQLSLDRANLKAAKSAETARKAEEGFNKLLGTATTNAAGVAEARDALTAAQDRLNQMQEAGITSGAEYEAAQKAVTDATNNLKAAFVAGGGDAAKFDTALNKVNLSTETASINARNASKEAAEYNQNLLNLGFGAAALVSQTVSMISGLGKFRANAKSLGDVLSKVGGKQIPLLGTSVFGLLGPLSLGAAAVGALMGTVLALERIPYDSLIGKFDNLGQAIGKAFPVAEDALTSFGDAFKSSVDFLAKGSSEVIESLTGIKLQADIANKSFSELVEMFLTKGTTGWQEANSAISAYVNTAKAAGMTEKEIIELAKKHNDENGKLAKSTDSVAKAAADQAAALKGAITAADGNTAAFEALQRTHDSAKITIQDFNAAERESAGITADLTDEVKTMNDAITDIDSAMSMATGSATSLSNIFPDMKKNIDNALLGQEQGLDIAIQLWNDFNSRVQEGQYEVGEFTKYLQDLGYEITPGIQAGIDAIGGIQQKIEEARGGIGDYVSDVTAQIAKGTEAFQEHEGAIIQTANGVRIYSSAADEATQATGEELGVMSELKDSLLDSIDKHSQHAIAMTRASVQQLMFEDALAKEADALETSNAELIVSNRVRADATAQTQQLQTAVNNELIAINDEADALEERSKLAADAAVQEGRLTNARDEGIVSAKEFIAALDEEVAQQQAYDGALRKTVRGLSSFGAATVQTTDQLEEFLQVAAGAPEALNRLASELGALAQSATSFLEFKGDEDELFGDWEISDKVPNEIRDMMTRADWNFIEGRAQLERSLEYLRPLFGVKAAQALQQGSNTALAGLRGFGNQAADIVRSSVDTITPSVQELASAFDALGEPGTQTVESLQRVVTAMENAESPAADLRLAMADLAVQSGSGAEQVAAMAGGLDLLRSSAANAGKPIEDVVLSMEKMNTVTIKETGQVFGEINGQMVELKPNAEGAAGGLQQMIGPAELAGDALLGIGAAANAINTRLGDIREGFFGVGQDMVTLVAIMKEGASQITTALGSILAPPPIVITADVQQAGNAITSIVNTLSSLQAPPIILTADVQQAGNAIASIVNTLSSLKPPPIKITANNATAISQIRVVQTQLNAIKQTKIPKVAVNNVTALQQIRVVQTQLNAIKQTKIPKVTVNNSQALSQINRVKSALNSLKNITRTITYRYRTVGSPPRGAQTGMHERLAEDTLISAHKGEKVDISPYGGPAVEKPGPTHTITTAVGGGRGGGNEIVIPVTLMLDNKVLIRTVRRGLVEEVSGAM
jgi:hypothetical protein